MGRGLPPSGEVDDSRRSRGGPLRPDSVRAWQEDFYRHLYSRPELSHQEHRTAAHVAARLRHAGCEVHEQVGGTGVVGVLWTSDIVSTRPAAPRSVGLTTGWPSAGEGCRCPLVLLT